VGREGLDLERGRRVAERLRALGVHGILITAAQQGYITELSCGMPECYCPEELGGKGYFEPVSSDLPDWMPTHEHFPRAKREGGQRTVDNTVLGHRLCNRIDYSKSVGRSHAKDLARVESARRRATEQHGRPIEDAGSPMDGPIGPGSTNERGGRTWSIPTETLREALLEELGRIGDSFQRDELAYLALTSKPEFAIRDALAFGLHRRLWPEFVVAREWGRIDLAILSSGRPVLLLEAKAMYSMDAASELRPESEYPRVIREDIAKALVRAGDWAAVFALVLMTHPKTLPEASLGGVVKYLPTITRSFSRLVTSEEIGSRAREHLRADLTQIGPLDTGTIEAGSSFGVEVEIDWWLVGPVPMRR